MLTELAIDILVFLKFIYYYLLYFGILSLNRIKTPVKSDNFDLLWAAKYDKPLDIDYLLKIMKNGEHFTINDDRYEKSDNNILKNNKILTDYISW
jgi:hypothetical protein